jgi:hypothetical protein
MTGGTAHHQRCGYSVTPAVALTLGMVPDIFWRIRTALHQASNDELSALSLPGSSRQSMNTDGANIAMAAIMDARNKCGHDKRMKDYENGGS